MEQFADAPRWRFPGRGRPTRQPRKPFLRDPARLFSASDEPIARPRTDGPRRIHGRKMSIKSMVLLGFVQIPAWLAQRAGRSCRVPAVFLYFEKGLFRNGFLQTGDERVQMVQGLFGAVILSSEFRGVKNSELGTQKSHLLTIRPFLQ